MMISPPDPGVTALDDELGDGHARSDPDRLKQTAMIALSDAQLAAVMLAAGSLPVDKRSVFLERIAARQRLCGFRFTDADLDEAVRAALHGLIQGSAA